MNLKLVVPRDVEVLVEYSYRSSPGRKIRICISKSSIEVGSRILVVPNRARFILGGSESDLSEPSDDEKKILIEAFG